MHEFVRPDGDKYRQAVQGAKIIKQQSFFEIMKLPNGDIVFHPIDGDLIAVSLSQNELKEILEMANKE